jgi:acyl carrier protein
VDQSETQDVVLAAWQRAFPTVEVEPESDFYALGGDSLNAMEIIAEIRRDTPFSECSEQTLWIAVFEFPTVAEFSAYLRALADSAA